jgi:hypothetical protein
MSTTLESVAVGQGPGMRRPECVMWACPEPATPEDNTANTSSSSTANPTNHTKPIIP